MKCEMCNWPECEKTTTRVEGWNNDKLIVVTDVPVEKCPRCEEEFFDKAVVETLDKIISSQASDNPTIKPDRVMEVPVYSFKRAEEIK